MGKKSRIYMSNDLIEMLRESPESVSPIEFEYGEVRLPDIDAFRAVTRSRHSTGIPPTFVTRLRWGEFEWLRRGSVDMRRLLHTEQEYEFTTPILAGDFLKVSTRVSSWREKRGLVFAVIESIVLSLDVERLKVTTTFVLRGLLK